ncbi:MAG: pyridoxamine 5'-phosphate oxidase family protein [Candidatus Dormibacter sp.]
MLASPKGRIRPHRDDPTKEWRVRTGRPFRLQPAFKETTVIAQRTVHLDRHECMRLLQYQSFLGRVAFTADGVMQIAPVNYLADGTSLVFCSAAGGKLSALAGGAPAVFEVDESRAIDRSGWSVIVRGRAHEITDARELDYLRRGPLKSWAVSPSQHWIRIDIEEVSGVHIPAH